MSKPRHRRPKTRRAFLAEWAAAPYARVAVEALEDRFLLAGNAPTGLAPLDKGGAGFLSDSGASVQITLSATALGQAGGMAESGSVPSSAGQSSSNVDRLSGASDLSGDVASTSVGELDGFGSPVLYRIPVSPDLLEIQITFSWTGVSDSAGGSVQILNSAGRVLYDRALTNQPISLSVQLPPNAMSGGDSVYIQIKPAPGSSANAATSPLAPSGFTLEVSPITAPTQGHTGAGGSGSAAGSPSDGSQSPVGTPVGPNGPESAPSAPDHTIQVTSGPATPEGTQTTTAYVALPSGRAVQVGGIFETEALASPTRADSSAVDPILADLMPGPPLLMRGRLSASRSTDVPMSSGPPALGLGVAITNRLTPVMPIVLGPIARLVWAPDRWSAQGDLAFAMAPLPSKTAARLAVEPPLASLEPELIDLPMFEAPRPVRTIEQVAAVEAMDAPIADANLTPRDLRSRHSVVLGSLYFSSVLVLGLSAPTLTATLKRWRKPARREFRIPLAN